MPSEHVTGIVASVVGAVVGILAAYGTEVPGGVSAGIITLVGWLATLVTWWVRRHEGGARIAPADAAPAYIPEPVPPPDGREGE